MMRQLVLLFVQLLAILSYFITASLAAKPYDNGNIIILGGGVGGMSPLVLAGGGDRKGDGSGHIIILGGSGQGGNFFGQQFGGFGSYPWLFGGQNGW